MQHGTQLDQGRATHLGGCISGFPYVTAHFKRMRKRPSVKKLLAYEKKVNEGFVETTKVTIESCRRTLPGCIMSKLKN